MFRRSASSASWRRPRRHKTGTPTPAVTWTASRLVSFPRNRAQKMSNGSSLVRAAIALSRSLEVVDVCGARPPIGVARPFFGAAGHFLPIAHPEQKGASRAVHLFMQFAAGMDDERPRHDLDGF